MAKLGKLSKLKSAIKRWPSITKQLSRTTPDVDDDHEDNSSNSNNNKNLHPVFVGRSRRRYLLSSDVVHHPLFQELVDKSSDQEHAEESGLVVVSACEVVMFDHLLWMLQNAAATQLGSPDELLQFYT